MRRMGGPAYWPFRTGTSSDDLSSAALDAGAADDRLAAVAEAHERLAVAVVVRRPDDELGLLALHANGLAERGGDAAPVGDERVVLPLASDRRLVGVPGEYPDLGREGHEAVHDRALDDVGRSAADGVLEEDVAAEADRVV